MDALTTILDRAGRALGEGRLDEAEAGCGRALAQAPDSADALALGCVLAARRGDRPRALAMIQRAVASAPDRADLHNTLGQVLATVGERVRARDAFETALALQPNFAEVHYNLGRICRESGQVAKAADRFAAAARLRPDWAEAHFAEANARGALDDWEGAAAGYRRALERKPGSPEVLYNLGGALQALGRLEGAAQAYGAAVALRPDFAGALNNLGVVHKRLGDSDRALECYRRALAAEPDDPETHNNLCSLLESLDAMDEALAHGRRAVALRPDFAEAHNNLGVALNGTGRYREGDAAFSRALALRPDFTEARFNHAVTRLLLGDYSRGWAAYESRFHRPDWTHIHPHRYPQPRWQGEPFAGRRLYVFDEQGFGDTLQFVRYLPRVKALGGEVILETRSALRPLLAGVAGADRVVLRPKDPVPAADCDSVVPLMSLPGILGIEADTPPASLPYLNPDPNRLSSWGEAAAGRGLRVGLVWAGSPNHKQDRRRSCPLERFAPLGEIAGVRFFGLQKGASGQETAAAGFLQENFGEAFEDFADAAAAIAAMDLVISVDTAAAHLAGALGKEVWTLIPFSPDWRWGLQGEKTGWYPTMTLFRQEAAGDWDGVVARVARALRQRAGAGGGLDSVNDGGLAAGDLFQRAARAWQAGDAAAAETLCRGILDHAPDHAETLNLAAVMAMGRSAHDEALALARRATHAAPENSGIHRNLGRICERMGAMDEAAEAFGRAAKLAPNDAGPVLDAARTLAAAGRPEKADILCRRLLAQKPRHTGALNRLGMLLARTGREEEAAAVFDRALAVDSTSADAWTNKGALRHAQGRLDDALAAFDRALEIDPNHVDARFNRGQVRLLAGDFAQGWADYEARCEKPAWRRANPEMVPDRRWRGEPLTDQPLYVFDEQGMGDTLQFVRYLPRVKERCHRVVLVCAAPLVPLLADGICADVVKARGEAMPEAPGRTVSLLSLPEIFGTTEKSIPADGPYVFADAGKSDHWRKKMPGHELRAGLVWAGNPGHANDRNRSCSLESLTPILELSGVTWFGLQKGAGCHQVQELPEPLQFFNLGPELADFSDTAAAIENLDLVVTVDTAVAHLAGAMGKPVWVMLPAVPDWRWGLERDDTPWYPTMRLFRQKTGEGWKAVVREMTRELGRLIRPIRPIGGNGEKQPEDNL